MDMFCKTCRYDLRQAASGRCPECGEAFDPLLSESYHSPRQCRVSLPWRWIACFVVLFGIGFTYDFVVNSLAYEGHPAYINDLNQLQTCRSQIMLYANQHNDAIPTIEQLNDDWRILTEETNVDGLPVSEGDINYGPYLQRVPVNKITGSSTVALPGQTSSQDGWEYDPEAGVLRLVIPTQVQIDDWGLNSNDVVAASRP